MRPIRPAFFALLIALAGCAIAPTDEELRSADYGAYPTDHEAIARSFMDSYLKDGESARYKFLNQPRKFGTSGLEKKFGYLVCFDVNARNGFGAYVGYRRSYLLIKNGQVIDSAHSDGTYLDDLIEDYCKAVM